MSSWIAVGAAQDAVLPILVPAYVIAVTGNASYSGVVMGVLMLTGALGPALGRLTDRYRAHRVVLVLGNFGFALASVAYGLSSERGAILGLSIGFIPDQTRWSTDKRTVQRVRARLDHVSTVRVPAYPTARIAAVRAATPLTTPLLHLARLRQP